MTDLQRFKAEVLADTVSSINPDLICQSYPIRLNSENIVDIIQGYDLVIDGTDNFQTRFLLGDACYLFKVPLLHGAVHQFAGQIILLQNGGPCFRCLYNQPPELAALASCTEAGILGVVTGAVGTIMALEAIKHLANLASTTLGKLLRYDAMEQSTKHIKLNPDSACPACGDNPQITSLADSLTQCSAATGSAPQTDLTDPFTKRMEAISPEAARGLLTRGAALVDVRESYEYASGHIDKAISLPLSEIQLVANERLSKLAKEKPLVVYCKSGKRSLAALPFLQQLGYQNCYSVDGGIEAWY